MKWRVLDLGMVSIRRRKLLGLCAGHSSFLAQLPRFSYSGYARGNNIQNSKSVCVHSMPSVDVEESKETANLKVGSMESQISGPSSSKELHNQQYPELKRRKRHRRKLSGNQESCDMRGVYFKNMKWQAAIKVEKKQIHLGTVGTQEEAARLYDRAAFMCGREPNFELKEEEKQELRKFKWDEFLAITRSAITNKKSRRTGGGFQRKAKLTTQSSDWEGELGSYAYSASEDVEADTSFS